jgi:tetratricopeptide (TPR) repeat protein
MDWTNAAIAALNAGELHQSLGELPIAISYAQQSVELADRSGSFFNRVISRANLGDALHQSGQLKEAEAAFVEAEKIQRETQPEFSLLYSSRGFKYCDLLLTMGKYQEAQSRASQMIGIAKRNQALLDIALQYLLLGRLQMLQNQAGEESDYVSAAEHLNRAVEGLRLAARLDYLPLGLLARAELWRVTGEFGRARADIDEAASVAVRGSMSLHQADCHLAYAALFAATDDMLSAREHLMKAREMVMKMGYHRRDAELERMEAVS